MVNERIEKLISLCRDVDYISFDETVHYSFNEEKFAELLVKECADYVQFYYKDHACEVIAHDMKQHFGVK
jgi:hypothetical protein